MSVLAAYPYPRTNDEDIFRQCTKDCGVVTSTEDFQYFALRCIYCSEKFLYFDAFIGHMQTMHLDDDNEHHDDAEHHQHNQHPHHHHHHYHQQQQQQRTNIKSNNSKRNANILKSSIGSRIGTSAVQSRGGGGGGGGGGGAGSGGSDGDGDGDGHVGGLQNIPDNFDEIEDLTDADTALLEPQMVIKQEMSELNSSDDDDGNGNDHDNNDGDDDDDNNDSHNNRDDDDEDATAKHIHADDDEDNVDDDDDDDVEEDILPDTDLHQRHRRHKHKQKHKQKRMKRMKRTPTTATATLQQQQQHRKRMKRSHTSSSSYGKGYLGVKNEPIHTDDNDDDDDHDNDNDNSTSRGDDQSYMDDNSGDYGEYNNYGNFNNQRGGGGGGGGGESDFLSYDEMVEESLLGQQRDRELTMHIKDRKMIQFLIQSYKRNPFLWDHGDAQFRDRVKRARFLEWIVQEFKCRFNIALAKDAITRKWDNLRTVYKRECNRMALEKTNISTLWYFKELHFLNEVYSYNAGMSDAVVKETSYRRRFSAIWNDTSTAKLLSMVKRYQCFYNRFDPDYRSKEKRGEGLQQMAMELQKIIDVTTIQISKRISQLRFDYSKQKMERLNCERTGRKYIPNYIYYDLMQFMDDDVPPFKCTQCTEIVQTLRELDLHMLTHQPNLNGQYICNVCNIQFHNSDEFNKHKSLHLGAGNEVKYNCELCTASFREKSNYDEHLRRHNDELFLPSLSMNHSILDEAEDDDDEEEGDEAAALNTTTTTTTTLDTTATAATTTTTTTTTTDTTIVKRKSHNELNKLYSCDICHRKFSTPGHLNAHRIVHQDERDRCYKCEYPQCSKLFVSRLSLFDHLKLHYSSEEFKCDICGKTFKSTKNLQNHKQIHDKIKRYVCQICGAAFAQAAGLYLHKRRHNRTNGGPTTATTAAAAAAAGTTGGAGHSRSSSSRTTL